MEYSLETSSFLGHILFAPYLYPEGTALNNSYKLPWSLNFSGERKIININIQNISRKCVDKNKSAIW